VTVLSFAAQAFLHTGLAPWDPVVPVASVFIKPGPLPDPLPVSPFEDETAAREPLDRLVDWATPEARPTTPIIREFTTSPRQLRRRSPVPGGRYGRQLQPSPALVNSDSDGEEIIVPADRAIDGIPPEALDAMGVDGLAPETIPAD
jgi:hypothetical protein